MDERAGFENQYARKGIGGSNPPASANIQKGYLCDILFVYFLKRIRTGKGVGETEVSPLG